jgi:hypothetical protein
LASGEKLDAETIGLTILKIAKVKAAKKKGGAKKS